MPQPRNPLSNLNAKAAREQAAEFLGFVASVVIDVEGEPFEIPNPSLLSPDQQDRYDELEFQVEQYDRHPAPQNEDGTPKLGTDGVPLRGALMVPHRKDGNRATNYETLLAQALFGDDYQKFIDAGGYPSQVGFHWAQMRRMVEEREKAEKEAGSAADKSDDGAGAVEAVPESDSGGT